jgi:hypothetical protein
MSDTLDRTTRLEAAVARIEAKLDKVDDRLGTVLTDVAELRGRVSQLPSAWLMVTAIVAGQVALAGLIAAVVFGVAHLIGKV